MKPANQSAPEPTRLRQRLPPRYTWIDHRTKSRLRQCQNHALALYLILALISDRHGLSYYGDKSLQGLAKLDKWQLRSARQQLVQAGLIAHAHPMYQVLDLENQMEQPETSPQLKKKPRGNRAPEELGEEERKQIVKDLREFRRQLAQKRTQ